MLNGRRLRVLRPWGEFRLATLVPSPYTHLFHADGHATVAQWQSTGFVNQMLWVQLPPVASRAGITGFGPQGACRNNTPSAQSRTSTSDTRQQGSVRVVAGIYRRVNGIRADGRAANGTRL